MAKRYPDGSGQDQGKDANLHPEQSPQSQRRIECRQSYGCQHHKEIPGELLHNFPDEEQGEGEEYKSADLDIEADLAGWNGEQMENRHVPNP